MTLEEYRAWYLEKYNHLPNGKLIESFLKMYPQPKPPEPDPTPEEFWTGDPDPELPKFKLVREGM